MTLPALIPQSPRPDSNSNSSPSSRSRSLRPVPPRSLAPDYDDTYGDRLLTYGRCGFTKTQVLSMFDITPAIFDTWLEDYPYFNDCYQMFEIHAQAYWESMALACATEHPGGRKLNYSVWNRMVSNRFPDYSLTPPDPSTTPSANLALELANTLLNLKQSTPSPTSTSSSTPARTPRAR